MDTFTPTFTPSSVDREIVPRVLVAEFGDGCTQRAADGLNTLPRKATLQWTVLRPAEAQAIEDFFVTQAGYLAFLWTDPIDIVARQWICRSWSRGSKKGVIDSMTAVFELVFDL